MIEERLRNFIVNELRWEGSPDEISDDFPLIDGNVVDSLGIYRIVSFVEREFGVEILDVDLIPEHFGTIRRIARLVESRRVNEPREVG